MADELKTIPLVGPGGLVQATPDEAESLIGIGFEPAKAEDVEFYGPTQQLIGYGEALGRAAAGPLFTAAQVGLGAEPERIKKREEISVGKPISTAIELGGLILPGMAISKAASLAAKGAQIPNYLSRLATASKFTLGGVSELAGSAAAAGIEGQIARLATKYGVENAVFGAADEVEKKLLSDEPQDAIENALDVASAAGLSFVLGAGTGAAVAGIGKIPELWKVKEGGKTAKILQQAQKDANQVLSAEEMARQLDPSMTPPVKPTAADLGQDVTQIIKSSEDLQKVVEGLPPLETIPLETRKIVEDSVKRLRDQKLIKLEPHEGMLKALEDKQLADVLNVARERGDDLAKAQIAFEQHIKKQSVDGIRDTITGLAPNPIADSYQAGQKFIDLTENVYETKQKSFEGFFKRFDTAATSRLDDLTALASSLERSIPGVASTIQVTQEGVFKLKPYNSKFPFLRATHRAIGDIVKALNDDALTIGELRSVRKNLDNFLTPATPAEARAQISKLKSSLMDVIQENINRIDPDLKVRDTFKAYRQNEEYREALEKILGGNFGAKGVLEGQIKPENVFKRLFSNTVSVQDAKNLLGENWNSVLADYLAQVEKSVIDRNTGIFGSANFKNFLKSKENVLNVAFQGQEKKLQNLFDYTTLMRTIPDRTPANPSRTAPTLLELGKQLLGLGTLLNPYSAAEKAGELAVSKLDKKLQQQGFNSLFKDKAAKPGIGMYRFLESAKDVSATGFQAMQDFIKESAKGAYLTRDAIKSVFNEDKKMPVEYPSERSIQALEKKMQELEQNPQSMLDLGGEIGHYLPEQDAAIGLISTRVMQYLATQRPGVKEGGLLNKTREPSKAERQKYVRTLQIAENPAVVLRRLKEGTITSKDVQDVRSMYPEAYNSYLYLITKEVVDKKAENKNIPFRVRKGISLFSGMPLDVTLTPQAIQLAQSTYQPQAIPQQAGLPQTAKKSSKISKMPEMADTEIERRLKNR